MSKKKNEAKSGVVYSTNPNWEKTDEGQEDEQITETLPPDKQNLRITLDKKLKGGKKATVIYNFVGSDDDLIELSKKLKTTCAVGGTAKDGEIILQGDCMDKVKSELSKLGYPFKVVGG